MPSSKTPLEALNARSREIFRRLVETYLDTGAPVGARPLSYGLPLSAATVRNVIADLERLGLLFAPHISAGRMPTQTGLRLFVDGLLEQGNLSPEARDEITEQLGSGDASLKETLDEAGAILSDLSRCASLVAAPRLGREQRLKHMEFLPLEHGQALVVMVTEEGLVENQIICIPPGLPPSTLQEASCSLNTRLKGLTLEEARTTLEKEVSQSQATLQELIRPLVEDGLALWGGGFGEHLIVRGQASLLENFQAQEDLERARLLFEELEKKTELARLLDLVKEADGVCIFIGAETQLFSLSESALILSPFKDAARGLVGVVGVIGPSRLNYGRVIPMVDFTARTIAKLLNTRAVVP